MVTASNGGTLGQYLYDGDGKRVKKFNTSSADDRLFIYDAAGKLIEERGTAAPYGEVVAYVYAGARLLSTEGQKASGVTYMTADTLGSPRVNTGSGGAVVARHDYMPFGEEISAALTPQRTASSGYTPDTIRKKFTGYERDIESSLDFAQARYYNPMHGRFHSVDPEGAGAFEENPQSWNAYAYVGNNPLNVTDPDGEKWKVCDNQGNCTEISDAEANRTLFNRKGNHPEIIRKDGKIFDEDGNVAGTYVRTSFDDLSDEGNALIFGRNSIGEQGIKKGKLVGALALGGAAVGVVCGATGGTACVATAVLAAKAIGGKALSYSAKITRQMSRRGWNRNQVEQTVKSPHTTAKTTWKETGESATAYINKDGSYVVVKDATKEIIQISDKTRPWKFPQDWKWK